jgi:hypothetical protein
VRQRQSGSTTLYAVAIAFGVAALAFLFIYLPYVDRKEEAAQRALLEARKAAETTRLLEIERARAAEAREQARLAEIRSRDAQRQAIENRMTTAERRADEAQQQRMYATARREVQKQIQERDRIASRTAAEQRQIDELRNRCESAKKLPMSPSRDAAVHQACTRYDDAARRHNLQAINR